MIVYLDLIFLMNLLIDGSLLLLTAWIRKQRVNVWRITASAGVGASYVMMMFLPELSFLFTFIVKFLFSVTMLWIAFGYASLQIYLRNMAAFYMVNFAAAGGILGVHYMLQNAGEVWSGIWYSASGGLGFSIEIGSVFTVIVFFVVLLWLRTVISSRRSVERIDRCLAEVEVHVEGSVVSCTGLVDTGNQLKDPFTRWPVMVMEATLWEGVLPRSFMDGLAVEEADNLILQSADDEDFPWRERLRLIPYRGINNKGSQFMIALKPDKVTIIQGSRSVTTNRLLIGLDGGQLSSEAAYRAIIHPDLLEDGAMVSNNSASSTSSAF